MTHTYVEKSLNKIQSIKLNEKIDVQTLFMYSGIILVLIIATISMAIADDSVLVESFLNEDAGQISTFTPRGHIEDFSWIKQVSEDGVIEISGIGFSVVNEDKVPHSFEICTNVQGSLEKIVPSSYNSLSCTITDTIKGNEKLTNQVIMISNGVKVSQLTNISVTIQEV